MSGIQRRSPEEGILVSLLLFNIHKRFNSRAEKYVNLEMLLKVVTFQLLLKLRLGKHKNVCQGKENMENAS